MTIYDYMHSLQSKDITLFGKQANLGQVLWIDLVTEQTTIRSVKTIGGLTRGRGIIQSVRNLWVFLLCKVGVN